MKRRTFIKIMAAGIATMTVPMDLQFKPGSPPIHPYTEPRTLRIPYMRGPQTVPWVGDNLVGSMAPSFGYVEIEYPKGGIITDEIRAHILRLVDQKRQLEES